MVDKESLLLGAKKETNGNNRKKDGKDSHHNTRSCKALSTMFTRIVLDLFLGGKTQADGNWTEDDSSHKKATNRADQRSDRFAARWSFSLSGRSSSHGDSCVCHLSLIHI